ncbi:N-acetyl sugar amidotransferase [Paludibacter sp. 221]|uniref:N-acetyl sugar amidotransferase n=1 Tax=Paludibacter sp. 221 TaxID=2302939 RepID=UPI001D429A28|nr:N-acetyl sugar amidotransferase [Paludibacter sp. 221]NDV46027.1 N-acetyl sugar amidotransferase [Paludibacter sp. 221]
MKADSYKVCTRCMMDTTDKFIVFDKNGVCNHCHSYDEYVKNNILSSSDKKKFLKELISLIKKEGEGRKYDCIIGLSGGMDSSYVAYLVKKYNLRTLIVHFDNGWDTEVATENVKKIIKKTGYDYFNYKVDYDEFIDLQRAYLKASVVDIEVPTDMAIFSLIPKIALKYDVKYILYGTNIETESTMGSNWNYTKMDRRNLETIHKTFGEKELKTYPYYKPMEQLLFKMKKIKQINILLYDECNYSIIKDVISKEFGWEAYSVKHGESVFTKFYQSYILPRKFGIDKRKAHLSDQINSHHITRAEALNVLATPLYLTKEEEVAEYNHVLDRLGFTDVEFERIMNIPVKSHNEYSTSMLYGNFIDRIILKLIEFKPLVSLLTKIYQKNKK